MPGLTESVPIEGLAGALVGAGLAVGVELVAGDGLDRVESTAVLESIDTSPAGPTR